MRPQQQMPAAAEPPGHDLAVAGVAKRALSAMHPRKSLAPVELVDLVHTAVQFVALRTPLTADCLGPPHERVVRPRRSLGRPPLSVPAGNFTELGEREDSVPLGIEAKPDAAQLDVVEARQAE